MAAARWPACGHAPPHAVRRRVPDDGGGGTGASGGLRAMTTALLLLLSAVLIISGVAIIWRDVHRKGREPFLVRNQRAEADPELEVTIAHRATDYPELGAPELSADPPDVAAAHASEASARWLAVEPVITAAVNQVNAVLAQAGVAVGAPGEPSRSMGSRGYGVYRRIMLGGESVAWLRLELDAAGQLQATVKAHKDDLAAINASSAVPAFGLGIAGASDLLSECLKPAASFAMSTVGGGDTVQWASETAWKVIAPTVSAALQAANGALAQAGARFVPVGAPAWMPELGRHRLTVSVEVFNSEIARMLLEQVGDEIEVAVGLPDARLAVLGRRQRIPLKGLSTHVLAELIASCTWPAIAHYREG
jgi:hypothetical protein